MQENAKVPLKITAQDIVGDCPRLNRRFDLAEGRISTTENGLSGVQSQETALSSKVAALQTQVESLQGPSGTAQPVPLVAPATANLTLTTGYQSVPGMTFQLTKNGWWKFDVTVRWSGFTSDFGNAFYCTVKAGGSPLSGTLIQLIAANMDLIIHRSWVFKSITGTEQIQVVAEKTGGAGTSAVLGSATPSLQTTVIIGVWVGPSQ